MQFFDSYSICARVLSHSLKNTLHLGLREIKMYVLNNPSRRAKGDLRQVFCDLAEKPS